ncbi:hypothetical protein RHMOL_Rhmol04G0289800 [Rhododendron molle]|uniref:Uncharacterized protein n=1 Tax=Rhododendron molle TaxID=49168 RepID=A0ACC0P5U4_RHOML|nr:hypothetical protein RHMOL_Rhmol04G0289800 [Rhododendron molle]
MVSIGLQIGAVVLQHVLSWAKQFQSGNSKVQMIFKLSLAATIYWLWMEHNGRVLQNCALAAT